LLGLDREISEEEDDENASNIDPDQSVSTTNKKAMGSKEDQSMYFCYETEEDTIVEE
jgi:hypothetical protein